MFRRTCMLGCAILLLHATVSYAKIIVPFNGEIDVEEKKVLLNILHSGKEPIVVKGGLSSEDVYQLILSMDHVKTPLFDISTVVESSIDLIKDKNGQMQSFKGDIVSKYTLINYKPVEELMGEFELKNKKLTFNRLSIGGLVLKGVFQLEEPYSVDVTIQIDSFGLLDFILLLGNTGDVVAEGEVNGDVRIVGKKGDLKISGNLYSYRGEVGDFQYENIILNLEGKWPKIYTVDSTITTNEGMIFQIAGVIDLLSQEKLSGQIKKFSIEPLISDDGKEREWTLKRVWDDGHSGGSTQLKYLLRKEEGVDGFSEQESGIFGVERKMEF